MPAPGSAVADVAASSSEPMTSSASTALPDATALSDTKAASGATVRSGATGTSDSATADARSGASPAGPPIGGTGLAGSTPTLAGSMPGLGAAVADRSGTTGVAPTTSARARLRESWAPPAALVGVVVSVAVAFSLGAQAGCFVLAGVLLLAAVVRALDPGDGPAGVAVRSKTFDVSLLSTLAAVIAVLAATASGV